MSIVTAASQFNFLASTQPGASTASFLNTTELDKLAESIRGLADVFTVGVDFRTAPNTPKWAFAYREGTTAAKIVLDRMIFGALSRVGQYASTLIAFGECDPRDEEERVPNALATIDWLYELAAEVLGDDVGNTEAASAIVKRSMDAIAFDKRLGCNAEESRRIWQILADELQGGARGEVQVFPSNVESAEKSLAQEMGRHDELLRHLQQLSPLQVKTLDRAKKPEQQAIVDAKAALEFNISELSLAIARGLNHHDPVKETTTDPIEGGLEDEEAAGDRKIEAALAEEFGGVFKTDDLYAGRTTLGMH